MPRTMLHFNNVFWLGGVPMFIRDMIAAYPEFYHVSCYNWSSAGFAPHPDYDMAQEWQMLYGCRVAHMPDITPEALDEINPAVIIMHNTQYKRIVKINGSWDWLRRWPIINIHHMRSDIIVEADHHVCVSRHVTKSYSASEQKHLGSHAICPPTINAAAFAKICRPKRDIVAIGKICSDWNPKKYPAQLLNVMKAAATKYPNTTFSVVGAEGHWKNPGVPRLTMPTALSKPLGEMLGDLDIFLYINDPSLPETWCRAVTEAMASGLPVVAERRGGIVEQIEDGVDGFLCETDAEFLEKLGMLIESPERRATMGRLASIKVQANFGFDRLHRELDRLILRCIASAA